MKATWSQTFRPTLRGRRNRRLLLLGLIVLMAAIANCLHNTRAGEEATVRSATDADAKPAAGQPVQTEATVGTGAKPAADQPAQAEAPVETVAAPPVAPGTVIARQIQPGDNLSAIFDDVSIGQPVLYQILAADESLLALDVLHPGNRLTFTLDEATRGLMKMELYIHPGKQVVYRRIDGDAFGYEEVVRPGVWEQQLVFGEISGSFYLSAISAGLTRQDAGNIAELFQRKLNFTRDIRSGDRFQVVRREQFVDGQYTGQSYVEAVRIFNRSQTYTAFLFEDGNYYDENGESLASAFLRYPYRGYHRISSSFNPKRKHPITGRISPHNGTDFSMSIGTQVVSTGDGVVTRVKDHPYAGKYIEIQHSGQYVTRYLHLSRTLVKRGQKVKRGEVIAKSGNTGRSTGPHLHFELHINGRPVDPVTAKIPLLAAIPESKRPEFKAQCTALIALMEQPLRQIAKSDAPAEVAL
jgi:murein DD-endopeptidase